METDRIEAAFMKAAMVKQYIILKAIALYFWDILNSEKLQRANTYVLLVLINIYSTFSSLKYIIENIPHHYNEVMIIVRLDFN